MAKGIETRHVRSCRSREGGRCNCEPSYRAHVYDHRTEKLIRKTFPSHAAAKNWRQDALVAHRRGQLSTPSRRTLRDVAEEWLRDAEAGLVTNRSGRPYRPSSLRGYRRALKLRVLPALGAFPLSDLRRRDVQAFADGMRRDGLEAATVTKTLDPLRAIYRYAERRDLVDVNPTRGLDLPRGNGRRERVAPREEALALIAALPEVERPLWAAGFFTGLRRGELRALRWSDVDLEANRLRVSRAWDDVEGELAGGKTKNAGREVGLAAELRRELLEHRLRTGRRGDDLVFGRTASEPFIPSTVRRRALVAWEAAELQPIGLHETRHTYISLCIAAGVNPHTLMVEAGHGSYAMTMEHYGKTMPGAIEEATAKFDAYLEATS